METDAKTGPSGREGGLLQHTMGRKKTQTGGWKKEGTNETPS